MRHGPQGVAGDKFRLGPILEHGNAAVRSAHLGPLQHPLAAPRRPVLPGHERRRPRRWSRTGEIDPATWSNSRAIDQPLPAWVRHHLATTDLVVIGSQSVVDELAEADLVDEYRLLTFPTARLRAASVHREPPLELVSAEQVGPAVLSVLTPDRA